MFRVIKAHYVTSAVNSNGWVKDDLPEILFLGRSNVGKSSFLNMLTNYHGLAKVSQRPGKTQMLNFFDINNNFCRFVDAPGYGFARVNDQKKLAFANMMDDYLLQRKNLKLVCLLIDLRRVPNEDDISMYEYLNYHHLNTIIIGTKLDKISNNEIDKNVKVIQKTLKLTSSITIIKTSSITKKGLNECNEAIGKVLVK